MVTTRRSDYITPDKNPPGPLKCSPALCRPGDKEEEAEAEEGNAISVAVDYAASLTRTMLQRGGTTTMVAMTVG